MEVFIFLRASDSARTSCEERYLKIRDSQLRSLSRTRLQQFVVEMMTHLRAHFPGELAALQDWELGEELERCLDRAAEYGISSRRDSARFLELATCFGWSFDTELGWPAALLREPTGTPSARLARVHERCLQSLEQAATKATHRQVLGV